jgi:hypothetical protein
MNLDTLRKLRETDATRTFSLPHELIDDPALSRTQKREILAEWASDASAIESFPALRLLQGTTFPVTLSAIRDALATLDGEVLEQREVEEYPRQEGAAKRRKNRSLHPSARERKHAIELHTAY